MPKRFKAYVNPRVLRWARESAGLDLEQAARKIKRSVEELRAWESGESQPSIPQAREAARVYRRPFAALYLPRVPKEPAPPRDFRRMSGDAPRGFSPELRLLIREVRNKQRWASQWRRDRGEGPLRFVGSWTDIKRPSDLARRIRKALGIETEMLVGKNRPEAFQLWYDLVELGGIYVFRSREVSPHEARGLAMVDGYAPFVFVNIDDSTSAQIFTLLHEVAHIWIGSTSVSNPLGEGDYRSGAARIERFCNRVAAEVLMPPDEVDAVLSSRGDTAEVDSVVASISLRFKVSSESAARTLLDRGVIEQPDYEAARRAAHAEWVAKRERDKASSEGKPVRIKRSQLIAHRNGDAFVESVLTALDEEDIGEGDFIRLLDTKLKHLEGLQERAYTTQKRRSAR